MNITNDLLSYSRVHTCATVGDAGSDVVPRGRGAGRPAAAARQAHRHEQADTRARVSLHMYNTLQILVVNKVIKKENFTYLCNI